MMIMIFLRAYNNILTSLWYPYYLHYISSHFGVQSCVSDLGAVCGSAWQHEPAVRLRRAHGQSDPRPAAVRLRGAVVPGARAHVPADPAQVPRGLRVRRHRLRRLALHDRHVERVQLGAGPLPCAPSPPRPGPRAPWPAARRRATPSPRRSRGAAGRPAWAASGRGSGPSWGRLRGPCDWWGRCLLCAQLSTWRQPRRTSKMHSSSPWRSRPRSGWSACRRSSGSSRWIWASCPNR